MTPLEIHHVTKRFSSLVAVDDVSLSLNSGEVLCLTGANGAGKTTLIRLVCGLLKPDSGTVSLTGQAGYMSQQFSLVEELTVLENIRLYGTLYGLSRAEFQERSNHLLQSLNLGPWGDRQARHLSAGWRQTLSFAVAILANPAVLVLDEPTSGLDQHSRQRFWQMIREKATGGACVMVSTHYTDEIALCDRHVFMRDGKLEVR